MVQRLKNTSELEELITETNSWISERGQAISDIDKVGMADFYKQLAKVERATVLVKSLRKTEELQTVEQLTESVSNLDKQIKSILDTVI